MHPLPAMDIVPGHDYSWLQWIKKTKTKTKKKPTKKKNPQQNKERKAIPADQPVPTSNGTPPSSHILTKNLHHFTGGVTSHPKLDPSHRHTFSPSSPFLIQTSCLYTMAVRLILASRATLCPTPPGPHHTTTIGSAPRPSSPTHGAWSQPSLHLLYTVSVSLRRR